MFESITIRGGESDRTRNIDLGSFAESLLFYQNVHLVFDHSSLGDFLTKIDIDDFRSLIRRGNCTVTFLKDNPAVHTDGSAIPVHEFTAFQLSANNSGKRMTRERDLIRESIVRNKIPIPSGKIDRLSEHITVRTISDLKIGNQRPTELALADVNDVIYLRSTISKLLSKFVPEFQMSEKDIFKAHLMGHRFQIETNLDFGKLNSFYHQRISPEHSTLTPAYFLSFIQTTRYELSLALNYNTDLKLPELSSSLLQHRVQGIIDKRNANASSIQTFEDVVVPHANSIRDVVNSGQLTFSDFVRVLDEAQKFKHWLKGVPMDVNLVSDYYSEVSKNDWLKGLPSKSARYAAFTTAGLAAGAFLSPPLGVGVGIGLGLADTFLFESILRGWTPNQFIEGPYLSAVGKK